MTMPPPLRIGVIDYLNVAPLYHEILNERDQNHFEMEFGVPTQINEMMQKGIVHASAISSYEYATHGDQYYILPNLSVSAEKYVGSILLFAHQPFDQLEGHISLTSSSATSIHLLYYLLRNHNISFSFSTQDSLTDFHTMKAQKISAHLLIGDPAIQEYRKQRFPYVYDLASLWNEETSLPFVFALWCIRRDYFIDNPDSSFALYQLLQKSKQSIPKCYPHIVKQYMNQSFNKVEEGIKYLENLRYDFQEDLQKGFLHFQNCCYEMKKLKQVMPLVFLPEKLDIQS